jgi:hypothetical protein
MAAGEDVRRPTFAIARVSSSHDFARSHGHLRRSMTRMMQKRQKVKHTISICPQAPQRSAAASEPVQKDTTDGKFAPNAFIRIIRG